MPVVSASSSSWPSSRCRCFFRGQPLGRPYPAGAPAFLRASSARLAAVVGARRDAGLLGDVVAVSRRSTSAPPCASGVRPVSGVAPSLAGAKAGVGMPWSSAAGSFGRCSSVVGLLQQRNAAQQVVVDVGLGDLAAQPVVSCASTIAAGQRTAAPTPISAAPRMPRGARLFCSGRSSDIATRMLLRRKLRQSLPNRKCGWLTDG